MSDYPVAGGDNYANAEAQDEFEREQNRKYEQWKSSQESAESQAKPTSEGGSTPTEQPKEDKGLVYNVGHTAAAVPLGTADFISDAIGIVPWLKPVDEWWDENSPRSDHPAHKIIRDASSIIVPTMVGGGVVVGNLKAATAARSIPQATRILGSIAAHAGVDATVTSISSHSKEQDNIARTLNDWLGWDIPWATRDTDSPDVIRKKNIYESAGLSVGVDLIGAAFSLGKIMRPLPIDEAAETALARHATGFEGQDPITQNVLGRKSSRTAAQRQETARRLMKDPEGKAYDAFINEPVPSESWRAVDDVDVNPQLSKIDNYRIQNNVGTTRGRARPVVNAGFMENLKYADVSKRARALLQPLFDNEIATKLGAKIKDKVVPDVEINRSVTKLYDQVYNPEVSLKEMENIIATMKNGVFRQQKFLHPSEYKVMEEAFTQAFTDLYNPKVMRASAMVTNQAAGTIADTSAAISMIGDVANTSRQQEIILDKLQLLNNEVRINRFIANKADEFKTLVRSKDKAVVNQWLLTQSDEFTEGIAKAAIRSDQDFEILKKIAKDKPEFLKPMAKALEATDGKVDEIWKLHRWHEHNIGFVKKAFIDNEPELPSLVVQGMNGVRYNNILSGLSSLRAMTGNSMLTAFKPASVLVGAKLTGDTKALKQALWTYGGIAENLKRAYKMMGEEWRLANSKPEAAMMRGRADLRQAKMDNFEAVEAMSEIWKKEGNNGKVALWNMAKGMSWYNNNQFVRWGTNAMYAIDGFTNSMMASGAARSKAYVQMMEQSKGGFSKAAFDKLQRKLYSESFDATGLLTDKAAKHASQEIALNLDSDLANRLNKFIEKVPAAKPLFLFPRTGINALNLAWSFTPGSSIVPVMTKARKVLSAQTVQEMTEALMEHGLEYSDEAFATLKSEYIGRQIMGGAVVTGAGIWALEGNLTGNGPHSHGERKRMMDMGWQPLSIKNPITGEWHSYKGFEPFDSLLGMVGDAVYYSNRIDQAITEQLYQKIAFSISMNVANKTFLAGFEPLVSMFSGDEGAFKRFVVNQGDAMVPFATSGIRSVLNNAITPQLKDVENDWGSLIQNKWKFLQKSGTHEDALQDQLDIYTGEPIRFQEPITAAVNALMPFGKSNGDMEPWRQWLLATGWDSQRTMEINPITGDPITTQDRYKINNWIAMNMDLSGQIERMMNAPDGFWDKKLKEYRKARGLKKQSDFPIKELVVHQELDRIHRDAMKYACSWLERHHDQYSVIGESKARIKNALRQGNVPEALKQYENRGELKELLNLSK